MKKFIYDCHYADYTFDSWKNNGASTLNSDDRVKLEKTIGFNKIGIAQMRAMDDYQWWGFSPYNPPNEFRICEGSDFDLN